MSTSHTTASFTQALQDMYPDAQQGMPKDGWLQNCFCKTPEDFSSTVNGKRVLNFIVRKSPWGDGFYIYWESPDTAMYKRDRDYPSVF